MSVKNDELLPLCFLRQGSNPQLCICYPGVNNQWSSPFNISNVGSVHVKLSKAGQRQKLIRIDILWSKQPYSFISALRINIGHSRCGMRATKNSSTGRPIQTLK